MSGTVRLVLFSAIIIATKIATAASGAEGDHDYIPWSELIIWQAINFTIVVVGLTILLKKPLREMFAAKAQEFHGARLKAEEVRAEAEAKYKEIQAKIKDLEDTEQKNLQEAKSQAAALRTQAVADAEAQAKKTQEESARLAQFELDRSIAALRAELITNSVRFAEDKIKDKLNSGAQQKLNDGFIAKVQGARP